MSAGPASHDRPTPPRGDEGELFARHHAALLRAVRRAVRAPEAVIEDACANAWAILLRRQPDRGPALFGWLRTVAVHEGYRLSREQRRVSALDDLAAVEGEGWEAFVADRRTLDASLEARRALRVLAALPEPAPLPRVARRGPSLPRDRRTRRRHLHQRYLEAALSSPRGSAVSSTTTCRR